MGVTKTGKTWRARYTVKGVRKNVGTFATKREAVTQLEIAKANDPDVPADLFEEKIRHDYLETPIPEPVYNPAQPTLSDRLKAAKERGITWLKEKNLI